MNINWSIKLLVRFLKKPFEDVEKLSNENVYIIELDYKRGVVNEAGEFLVKPAYSKIEAIFRENKLVGYKVEKKVKKEALWGLLSETGEILVKPTFDEIEDFNEKGLAVVESASKYGVFTDEGGLIVPVDYRKVEIIKQYEVILAELDYQVNGLYDFAGKVVLPAEYKEITISKGLAITKNKEDEKEIYQRNGKHFLLGKYDCINFVENFILANKKDNLETLVFDLSGSHLFSFSNGCYFELAKSPLSGFYRLEEKYGYGGKTYIDVKKKNHQPFYKSTYNKLKQLSQGVYRFERSYDEVYAKDTSSNVIVGPYQDIESLGNGYLKVRKNKRISYVSNYKLWGVITTTDEKIVESIYSSIEEFKSGLFFASKGDYSKKHHGAFNLNGAEVIPFCFDKVSFTDLNLVEATKGEEVFLVNPDGTCASNCEKYDQVLKKYYAEKQ